MLHAETMDMLEATRITATKGSRNYTGDWKYNRQFNKPEK